MYHESLTAVNSPIVNSMSGRSTPLYPQGSSLLAGTCIRHELQCQTISLHFLSSKGWFPAAKPGSRLGPGAERLPLMLPALLYNSLRLN